MDQPQISHSFKCHHTIMDKAMKKIKKNLGVARILGDEIKEMRMECIQQNLAPILPIERMKIS